MLSCLFGNFLFGSYWQKLCKSIQGSAQGKEKNSRKAIAALLIANLFTAIAKYASFLSEQEYWMERNWLKDVEPWTVVGGNPAKFIKNRVLKDDGLVSDEANG